MAIPILGIVGSIIDKVIPDAGERAALQVQLAQIADAEAQRDSNERIAQAQVNQTEASHSSLFVAGWRPAVGWGCVAGFVYTVIIAPAFSLEVADTAFLRDVLLGMLGINVLARSVEKVKGVAENTLNGKRTPQSEPLEQTLEVRKPKRFLGIKLPEKAPWE